MVHKAAVKHQLVNKLSGLSTAVVDITESEDQIPFIVVPWTKKWPKRFRCIKSDLEEKLLPENIDSHDVKQPTSSALIVAQSEDMIFPHSCQLLEIPGNIFIFDNNEVLGSKAPIFIAIQKLVLTSLRARQLWQAHHSTLVEHLEEREMYDSLRGAYYWAHMVANVFDTVKDCSQYPSTGTKLSLRMSWNVSGHLVLCDSSPPTYVDLYQEPIQETKTW